MTTLLLVLVIVLAVAVLGLAVVVFRVRRVVAMVPEEGGVFEALQGLDTDLGTVEDLVAELAPRVEDLERRLPRTISRTAVVAYDAFDDIAGNQSRTLALLNELGDGFVVSVLVGRSDVLFFTKEIRGGVGTEPLSPEEEAAVARAMGR